MPHTDEYVLALAVKIVRGQIKVNGQELSPGSTVLPEGVTVLGDYYIVPENSLLDTVGNASFTLHPANTRTRKISPDPYAEVRGNNPDWRICVSAPMAKPGPPEEDKRNNKTPVSYLHRYDDTERRPYLELQVNEGCVRVALERPS